LTFEKSLPQTNNSAVKSSATTKSSSYNELVTKTTAGQVVPNQNIPISSQLPADVGFKEPKRKVSKAFIHCSDTDIKAHDNIQTIREWHIARGFDDVGYHYFIRKTGQIENGRPLEIVPAAQEGHNKGSIAICVSGSKKYTDESMEALKKLCIAINKVYKGKITFHGHCEVANKTCPVFDYKKVLKLDKNGKLGI
jgi:N-acetyl-anhydromuramyl-L-alanine amidase AmpD